MGAIFRCDIYHSVSPIGEIQLLRENGRRVLAATLGEHSYTLGEVELMESDCIVIGNEGHGIDEKISIHDFRMVQGPTHTNLIFDVVVPLKFRLSDEEVMNRIKEGIRSMQGNYFGVVKIDKPYIME